MSTFVFAVITYFMAKDMYDTFGSSSDKRDVQKSAYRLIYSPIWFVLFYRLIIDNAGRIRKLYLDEKAQRITESSSLVVGRIVKPKRQRRSRFAKPGKDIVG